MRLLNCEDCIGDFLKNSKNVLESFNVENVEDSKFMYDTFDTKDSYDMYINSLSEQCYECLSTLGNMRTAFNSYCWDGCNNLYYCDSCFSCSDLFGCIGLRHKKYCILNKQYTKEEYEQLVPRIIEHMMKTNEYGEFFPIKLSPFAYNETVAQEYFPLEQERVEKEGWQWRDEIEKKSYKGPVYKIPDDISDVSDSIIKEILLCEVTQKPYRIISQELEFYKKFKLPLPRRCPDQRYRDRLVLRNPRKLWERDCMHSDSLKKPNSNFYSNSPHYNTHYFP